MNERDLIKVLIKTIDSYNKALVDNTIKGIFRTLGDTGDNPANITGKTFLQRLYDIEQKIKYRKNHHSTLYNYSLAPATEYSWLSISGTGKIVGNRHKSSGVIPEYAKRYDNPDATIWYDLLSVYFAYDVGWTTVGLKSWGPFASRVITWDTTNHIYNVAWYALGDWFYFRSSFVSKAKNDDPANAATIDVSTVYQLFTSSKDIKLKPRKYMDLPYVESIREMVKKDFGPCDAAIFDHYVVNPDDPEDQWKSKPRLILSVADEVFERRKDEIINKLIRDNHATDIISESEMERYIKNKKTGKVGITAQDFDFDPVGPHRFQKIKNLVVHNRHDTNTIDGEIGLVTWGIFIALYTFKTLQPGATYTLNQEILLGEGEILRVNLKGSAADTDYLIFWQGFEYV